METDAFSLIKSGTALITESSDAENIAPGNIIIFSDDEDKTRIGEVSEVNLDDGVYTFQIRNDLDEYMTIGQSRILGKGIWYSDIIGAIVSFATSVSGVCVIAILPCAAFIILEIISSIKQKDVQTEFETVKKQDEIPTYLPRREYTPYEERPAFSYEREHLMEEAGLFTPPRKNPPRKQEEHIPVSERDIDRLIKETRAKHLAGAAHSSGRSEQPAPAPRQYPRNEPPAPVNPVIFDEADTRNMFDRFDEPPVEQGRMPTQPEPPDSQRRADADIKHYEPPRRNPPKSAPRVSRLDSLLQEESGDSRYDIDNILKNIEKNK